MAERGDCDCDGVPGGVCPRCGGTRRGSPPSGVTVWAEEHVAPGVPPRTAPPRHAQAMADAVYDRVAGGTRTARPPLRRRGWRGFLIGAALLATAGVVYALRLDAGLVHVGSIGLAVAGGVTVLNTLLGHRP